MEEEANKIYNQIISDFPEAVSFEHLHSLCDANEYIAHLCDVNEDFATANKVILMIDEMLLDNFNKNN